MTVDGTQVVFNTSSGAVAVRLRQEGAVATNLNGGWQTTERPLRRPFVDWAGGVLVQLEVAVMLDGWRTDTSVEDKIRVLERACMNDGREPSPITVTGAIPFSHLRWVISEISWDSSLRRSSDGARVRQSGKITLLQFEDPDVRILQRPVGSASKSGIRPKEIVVKRGDTLRSLARKHLGSADKWKLILNKNRDRLKPGMKLKIGMKLRLP